MQQSTVTIYTSPNCAYCHQAIEYLKDNNIEFTEKDISTDEKALQFILEKVGQPTTPIITINDEIVVGFDRPAIEQALKDTRQ